MYGMLSNIQIAVQNSYSTVNVSSLVQLPFVRESIKTGVDQITEPTIRGRFGESPRYRGRTMVGGTVDFVPQPRFLGTLLYGMGGVNTVSITGSIATHKFRPRDTSDWDAYAAVPPFSIVANRDVGSGELYFDMCVDEVGLEFANGELLRGTVGFVGGRYATNAAPNAAFNNEADWTWDQFSASYGGEPLHVRKGSVKISNQLEGVWWMGGDLSPSLIKRKDHVQVTGALTLQFDTVSHGLDFTNKPQTTRQLLLSFVSATNSPAHLKIDVAKMRITDYSPVIQGPGAQDIDLTFVGEYDTTSSYAIEYTLVNTIASYP